MNSRLPIIRGEVPFTSPIKKKRPVKLPKIRLPKIRFPHIRVRWWMWVILALVIVIGVAVYLFIHFWYVWAIAAVILMAFMMPRHSEGPRIGTKPNWDWHIPKVNSKGVDFITGFNRKK